MKRFFLLAFLLTLVFHEQGFSQTWQSINGGASFTFLQEGADGKLFAGWGDFPLNSSYGVYYSLDGGFSWVKTPYGDDIDEIEGKGSTILFTKYTPTFQYEVYLSTNNGGAWTRIYYTSSFPNPILMNIADSDTIFAVLPNNNGSTWQVEKYELSTKRWRTVGNALATNFVNFFKVDHANAFWVGTYGKGLYYSTDKGQNWNNNLLQPIVSAIYFTPTNSIIIGTSPSDTSTGGVYISDDTGRTWRGAGLKNLQILNISRDSAGALYASTDKGIYRSTDVGNTWNSIGPIHSQFDDMVVTAEGNIVVTGLNYGIYITTNYGESWSRITSIRQEDVSAIATDDLNIVYAGSIGNRIFISSNTGSGWRQVPVGSVCEDVYSLRAFGSTVFAGTDCGVYRTTNHGVSWELVTALTFSLPVYSVSISNEGIVYAGTTHGLFRSTDSGETWSQAGLEYSTIYSVVFNQQGKMFAAGGNDGIFSSIDSGTTWNSIGLEGDYIQSLAISGSGTLVAGTYGGVYRSTNGGGIWSFKSFDNTFVNSVSCRGSQRMFAGSSNGVYSSSDGGTNWSLMNQNGLGTSVILSMGYDQTGNLLVGTYRGGTYRTVQSFTGVEETGDVLPEGFALYQNYPNPFNPTTTVSFTMSHSGSVTLKVYNMLGKEVAVLLNDIRMETGYHSLPFNASSASDGLSSGVYYYRLTIKGSDGGVIYNDIRKMLFVK